VLERLRQGLVRMPEPPPRPRLKSEDWLGALSVFFWVFLITLPVVIPFLVVADPVRALRVSNGVALVLMFICGYAFGRFSGLRPWSTGVGMVVLGTVLVALTIALGG
jgi:VIT1/CCC1 family predicted Fe2+/Mn2+ transporter